MNFQLRNFYYNKECFKVYSYIFLHSTRFLASRINEPPLLSVQGRGEKYTYTHPGGRKRSKTEALLSSSVEEQEICLVVCGSESNYQPLISLIGWNKLTSQRRKK